MNFRTIQISRLIFAGITVLLLGMPTARAQDPHQKGDDIQRIKATYPLDAERIVAIAAMLSDKPKGMGAPYQDRDSWDKLFKTGNFKGLIADADAAAAKPLPALTHEIYMSFFNSNDSETSKKLVRSRIILFDAMVWAECLTNTGKYMPAIEAALVDLLNQKSWNFPAEDRKLTNYNGIQYTINLSAAAYAHDIAEALYLLNDKLKPELRKRTRDELQKKIFDPTLQAQENNNKNGEFTSLMSTGNHNAQTIAGVTGAALAVIEDKSERARFIAIAERYIKNSLAGFLPDGYCSEGLGYYNYGFKHYILLRETLLQATGGQIDLFADPKIQKIARYVPNITLINNVYPAIGDCNMNEKPARFLMYYLNRTLDLGLKEYDNYVFEDANYPPLQNVYTVFPNAASKVKPGNDKNHRTAIRSYFESAGVITVRPAAGSGFNMAATIKGGHNNELHNHNDIGSYTVVIGKELLSGDPGLATYTSKTFTPKRYTIKTIASYGHPVPLVAGKEQLTGKEAAAKILGTTFTDDADHVLMDITSGYPVPELKKLLRSFTYNRTQEGYFEVVDEFEFNSLQSYETAIITRATWKQDGNTIELMGLKEKLIINIHSSAAYTIVPEVITETPKPYTRLAIRLKEPAKKGKIVITYKKGV